MQQEPVRVAILVFPASTASIVHGLYDLFHAAGRDYESMVGKPVREDLFEPRIVAARSGTFSLMNGLTTTVQVPIAEAGVPDIICVPEVVATPEEPMEGRFEMEMDWLRRCYAQGSILASACTGALLLAEAGLLDEHEGTTHWAFCDVMQQRHPRVRVRPKSALVMAGEAQRLVMAGGGTSWLDLALYLIARKAGVDTAMNVARVSMIDWHVSGQQPYATVTSLRQSPDGVIAKCQTWAAERFHEASPVAGMVQVSGLPERTFKPRFKQATGQTPLEYIHALRIEEAKRLLEVSDEPVEAIALECGYEDAGFFNRMFKRRVQLTPGQYRKRFGGMRRELAARI
ncbi:MAG: helix-turn-helix domain-containing protein [Flavobacteriales bacterium]|nr:helix-turn-helix domain-containing protein [Flavobacteriales bacterium]